MGGRLGHSLIGRWCVIGWVTEMGSAEATRRCPTSHGKESRGSGPSVTMQGSDDRLGEEA